MKKLLLFGLFAACIPAGADPDPFAGEKIFWAEDEYLREVLHDNLIELGVDAVVSPSESAISVDFSLVEGEPIGCSHVGQIYIEPWLRGDRPYVDVVMKHEIIHELVPKLPHLPPGHLMSEEVGPDTTMTEMDWWYLRSVEGDSLFPE